MMENTVVAAPTSLKVKKGAFKTIQFLYVAIIVILLYLPVIFIIIESFNDSVSNYGFGNFTFEWYKKMFYCIVNFDFNGFRNNVCNWN